MATESFGQGRQREERLARRILVGLAEHPAFGALISALLVFAVFSLWAPYFLTLESVTSILIVAAELGIVAMGVTLLMIAGEFDLSVGSVLGFSAVIVPWLAAIQGLPMEVAIVCALLAALTMGAIHGLIVVRTGIASFIVTLGGLLFWRSIVYVVTGGFPLSIDRSNVVLQVFSHRFEDGWNMSMLWFLALILMLTFVLTMTRFGNWIYASGGNERAARTSGVPVDRVKVMLFMLTSFCAFLAGLIQTGRFASVDANRGLNLELEAIAAAVIGGTSLRGGIGSVIGTVLGCLTVGMIRHGLALVGVVSYIYNGVIGLLIVLAVIVNRAMQERARNL